MSYPGEISHSNSANRELSNNVLLVVVRRRKVALHTGSHLMPIEAWRRAVSTTSDKSSWSNGLKTLPRQIFSVCVKFGGNPCRDVDTLRFYTHRQTDRQTDRHTDTHTGMKLYIIPAVRPVLCTGHPYFLFTLNGLFQSLCLALMSHATTVPVCMCLTHHLPFYWFWNLLPFLFHFPTQSTIWLKVRTHIAFGGSFELAMHIRI